jgi:hypothetical protein
MHRTLRLLFFFIAFLGLVALGGRALARWSGQGETWELARWLLAEARRRDALDVREEATRRYNQSKQAVTDEVIAGRLSLTEAAERFAQFGELMDGAGPSIGRYVGADDEQALCRNVIVWASCALPRGSSQQTAVLDRLKAEYRERFGAAAPAELFASLTTPPEARHRTRPHRTFRRRVGSPGGGPASGR